MRGGAYPEIRVPGDKSITHRALILASLARGTSRLTGLLAGADTGATAAALRALGVGVPPLPEAGAEVILTGGGIGTWRSPRGTLDCANSGTTARLLLGALAGVGLPATLDGDESLRSRPMRRVTGPLSAAGAVFAELGRPDRLPVQVRRRVSQPLRHSSPVASAQVKSALLLAGITAGVPVDTDEPVLSRDHTERMVASMGGNLVAFTTSGGRPGVRYRPEHPLEPLDFVVPGDVSSAAYFLALGALLPSGGIRLPGVGANPTRTGFLRAIRSMGARIDSSDERESCGEPRVELVVHASGLHGIEVGVEEVPEMIDEIPILAVLASRADGVTRITGAAELRLKESDRLSALAVNLSAIGVSVEELEDGLVVRGDDAPLHGDVRTFGDHRIAMAFGVLAALPGNDIRLDRPGVVEVSYPRYWADIAAAAGHRAGA